MQRSIFLLLLSLGLLTQATAQSFWRDGVLGQSTPTAPWRISADVYPFLFLGGGWGGTVGFEWAHWQVGVAGFGVTPPPFIENTFFNDTEGLDLGTNHAVEGLVNYYLRPDRQWLYVGLLGGPEWFDLTDPATGTSETLVKTYLVPRLGLRWFPFQPYVYLDASVGYSFNLGGAETRSLGSQTYEVTAGALIYFLQLGVRLGPKEE